MDELIKRLREDVPEALVNCGFDFVEGWSKEAADAIEELRDWNNTLTETVAMLMKQIAELGKESARWQEEAKDWYLAYMGLLPTRWISVEEALPEEEQPVQVTYLGFNDGQPRSDMIACLFCGNWCYWDGEPCSYDKCKVKITHWTPLSAPPKEDAHAES